MKLIGTTFSLLCVVAVVILLVSLGTHISHATNSPPPACKKVTVDKILSLNYRDANILLSDGTVMTVNQATLKPGDSMCYYPNDVKH